MFSEEHNTLTHRGFIMKREDLYWVCEEPVENELAHKFFNDVNALIDRTCDKGNFESRSEIEQNCIANFITHGIEQLIKNLEKA